MSAEPIGPDAGAGRLGAEAARQAALVAAIRLGGAPQGAAALDLSGDRVRHGLEAYRAGLAATAERALAAAFPTVRRAVGDPAFAALARDHVRDEPPSCGDLGEWGASFPDWLDARPALKPWPWLADSARLDLAVHRAERAADAVVDADSWSWLAAAVPERARLRFAPGAALVVSRFPVGTIHAVHRGDGEADLAPLRAALEARVGESVLVVREGWRAAVHVLDAPGTAFVAALLDGRDLATALSRAGARLDFTAWLATALRAGWLEGAAPVAV
jgi:hypothetical protein